MLFYGCQILRTTNITTARLAAIREASLAASRHGLRKIVVLTTGKNIEMMWSTTRQHTWQRTNIIFEDLLYMQQHQDLSIHIKVVPNIIIEEANFLATQDSHQFLNVMHISTIVSNINNMM